MRILVIEDEVKTAGFIRRGLGEQGFDVDLAGEGEEGLRLALAGDYALAILDVMLPGRDGWSILEELRRVGKPLPVLFLTAKDGVADRVKGLELGADDYLVKPFAFSELLARVRSILRRTTPGVRDTLRIADLELDLLRQKALRGGQALELTPKEFALLSLLARRKGEALSRQDIAAEVWEMQWQSDTNVVDVHIRRLRAKLDDPFEHKLIHTIRGVGYVLDERR